MRINAARLVCRCWHWLAIAMSALAQEGHPLTGHVGVEIGVRRRHNGTIWCFF